MSLQTELAEVEAAISQALTAQKWKHGDDEAELPSLSELRDLKAEIEARIKRASRGPRVTGVSMSHN